MTAAMKTTTSSAGHPLKPETGGATPLLNEELMSRSVAVLLLIPKWAAIEATEQEEPEANKPVAYVTANQKTASAFNARKNGDTNPNSRDTFAFGEVTVCFSAMETRFKGRIVDLTIKEFKALAYFIKNPRRVISRDEFLNNVWGYQSYPCTRTVDNHIWQLRRKLETEPARPKHFHTVHGVGYRFLPYMDRTND